MRIGTASVRRRAQLLALEPALADRAAARKHRHAPAQAGRAWSRRGRAGGVRARPTWPRRRDRPVASSRTSCCRRRDRARSRCKSGSGDEHLVAAADDAETRRRVEAERRCVALIGGGCLAPVAAYHDGDDADSARRRRGRRVGRAAARRRPGAVAAELATLPLAATVTCRAANRHKIGTRAPSFAAYASSPPGWVGGEWVGDPSASSSPGRAGQGAEPWRRACASAASMPFTSR